MKCERCQKETAGYSLYDYCAECSKNLCADCMIVGCCGNQPAKSGMAVDREENDEHQDEAEVADQRKYK